MTIRFDIPHDIEQQIRTDGVDLARDAKEVYLMEQYRQARITHRQLEAALDLSFPEAEQLLKQQDIPASGSWTSKNSRPGRRKLLRKGQIS